MSAIPPSQTHMDATVQNYRLIESMRQGDIPALEKLIRCMVDPSSSHGNTSSGQFPLHADLVTKFGTILHLAVAIAPIQTVEWFLQSDLFLLDVNAKHPTSGETPLHVAARSGRQDVIELLLLRTAGINDGLRDAHGRRPLDVAKSEESRLLLANQQAEYVSRATATMHAIAEGKHLDNSTTAAGILSRAHSTSSDGSNPAKYTVTTHSSKPTGSTLEPMKSLFSDPRAGALLDINHRNPSTGNSVLHSASLRGDTALIRWCLVDLKADPFIRDRKGKFFYEVTNNDKVKALFKEVVDVTAPLTAISPNTMPRMESALLKWTNYASGYKTRWFVLEGGILSYFKNQDDVPNACRGSIHLKIASLWVDTSDRHRFDLIGKGSVRFHLRADHVVEAQRWIHAISQSKRILAENDKGQRFSMESQHTSYNMDLDDAGHGGPPDTFTSNTSSVIPVTHLPTGLPSAASIDMDPKDGPGSPKHHAGKLSREHNFSTTEETANGPVPHKNSLSMSINACKAQLSIQNDLFQRIEPNHLGSAIKATHGTVTKLLDEITRMFEDRERYWQSRYEFEFERKGIYEEALGNLARDYQTVEIEARTMADTIRRHTRKNASNGPSSVIQEEKNTGESEGLPSAPETLDEVKRDLRGWNSAEEESESEDEDEFFDAIDEEKIEFSNGEGDKKESQSLIISSLTGYESETYSFVRSLRSALPIDHAAAKNEVSLWSVLKNAIGKDLTKITLPVYFNEPLSMLQRLCEEIEYSSLLDLAWKRENSDERLLLVAAFAVSSYASTVGRVGKPFNPLLGETYEYVRSDRGFRYISEQVSHHPVRVNVVTRA
jgi:ankyrin repeat protein